MQFGTDQLLEAPGEELSFSIHWYVWADYVGHIVSELSFTFYSCSPTVVMDVTTFVTFLITLGLMCILCYSCSVYSLFTSLPANQNPYKTVLQVLNFARKHKHPIQRSALPWLYLSLHDTSAPYHVSTWLYYTLHWIQLAVLDSTTHYHVST